ncbi:MAG: hypothetical protein R3E66_11335 [bacterium]
MTDKSGWVALGPGSVPSLVPRGGFKRFVVVGNEHTYRSIAVQRTNAGLMQPPEPVRKLRHTRMKPR